MNIYSCPRYGYYTSIKQNYTKHINRQNPSCPPLVQNVPFEKFEKMNIQHSKAIISQTDDKTPNDKPKQQQNSYDCKYCKAPLNTINRDGNIRKKVQNEIG